MATWIAGGVAVMAMLVALLWCMSPWRRVASWVGAPADGDVDMTVDGHEDGHEDGDEETSDDTALPRLTVVMYSDGSEQEITEAVERLLLQDCPDFEIVVVCKSTMSGRDMLAGRLSAYPHVYVTFIPPGAHNLSERKLAITLGLKAAKGEVVLTTTSNVVPASEQWLSRMLAPFADPAVVMALGYTHMDFAELTGPARWYRQYDSVTGAAQWLGHALAGDPYRGDGYNLVFRRDTFFEHKGYARTINLHYGDDDLFVNELADGTNCRVVMAPEAMPVTSWGPVANSIWSSRKERYMFTSRWLPRLPFMQSGTQSLMQWLALGGTIAAALTALPSILPAIAVTFLYLLFQLCQILSYRRLAATLRATRLWWALPLFMLWRPVANTLFRIKHHSSRKGNFTWQR